MTVRSDVATPRQNWTLRAPAVTALWRRSAAVLPAPVAVAAVLVVAICARFSTIGADSRWLAALGRVIAAHQSVPSGVPFAGAPSAHFPNVLALAELIFYGLEKALGDRGLMLAQVLALTVAVIFLARDALARGATSGGTAAALSIVAVGALPSLAIVRVQLFSLALFPVVVALLRREARCPSSRIWLAVPLFALWSNLHGAVLIGFGLTLCYLLLSRVQHEPIVAVLVAASTTLALCVNPGLTRTFSYYHLGLTNVSVERGFGMWAPLSLTRAFDVVLVATALILAVGLRRARPALWELVALGALVLAMINGSRNGIWLLFFLVGPGAYAFRFKQRWNRLIAPTITVGLAVIVFSIAQGPIPSGASRTVIARAIELAHGTPVLAADIDAEKVALAGGRVWLSNPLEAFSHHDQSTYIDWLEGLPTGRAAVTSDVNVVLVSRGSATARLMDGEPNFVATSGDRTTVFYVRTTWRKTGFIAYHPGYGDDG